MARSERNAAFIRIWTCEENTYGERLTRDHWGSLSQLEDDDEPDVMLQDTVYRRLLAQLLDEAYARGYNTASVRNENEVKASSCVRPRKEYGNARNTESTRRELSAKMP